MAKRIILEMGSGNDLHGGDYTKAALRALGQCKPNCSHNNNRRNCLRWEVSLLRNCLH